MTDAGAIGGREESPQGETKWNGGMKNTGQGTDQLLPCNQLGGRCGPACVFAQKQGKRTRSSDTLGKNELVLGKGKKK